jgi:hypothetical protein
MLDSTKSGGNISIEAIEGSENKINPNFNNKTPFNVKNYLNSRLENGETSKDIRIRLLTIDKDSSTPFLHVHTHYVPSKKKTYLCLQKNEFPNSDILGHKCPFCEVNKKAYETFLKKKEEGDTVAAQRYKEISLQNKSNEECIIRCIERSKEADGPKFWKFNLRSDEKDPENQIRAIYRNYKEECAEEGEAPENIFDLRTGHDFKVKIHAIVDKQGKLTDKRAIGITMVKKSTPLAEDEETIAKWVNDEKKWNDVFVAKPYDYLAVIQDGGEPFFDKPTKKWINKTEASKAKQEEIQKREDEANKAGEEISAAEAKILNDAKEAEVGNEVILPEVTPLTVTPATDSVDDDTLPF